MNECILFVYICGVKSHYWHLCPLDGVLHILMHMNWWNTSRGFCLFTRDSALLPNRERHGYGGVVIAHFYFVFLIGGGASHGRERKYFWQWQTNKNDSNKQSKTSVEWSPYQSNDGYMAFKNILHHLIIISGRRLNSGWPRSRKEPNYASFFCFIIIGNRWYNIQDILLSSPIETCSSRQLVSKHISKFNRMANNTYRM